MEQSKTFTLQLPKAGVHPYQWVTIQSQGPIVILGGNGAGKTRLGALLDTQTPQGALTHRIAAQRDLQMPEVVQPITTAAARQNLLYGQRDCTFTHKRAVRWNNHPETSLLSDYNQLMVYLFAEEWEASTKFRQQSLASPQVRVAIPETKLDAIKRI